MANRFTVSFRVVDRASNAFRRIARSTQELSRANANAATQFANTAQVLLATAGSVTATFAATAAAAGEVEDAIARLETVTRGSASQIETSLNNAKNAAIQFSTEFTASAAEVVDAQFQIATAGVAVEEQIAATQGAFKLAVATQGTFAQSTQLLGSLLNTFGKAAEFSYLDPGRKVEALTDRLSLAVQRFQVTLPVLAESLKFVIGPASTLGLKFSEVTSALGVLNTAGFRGSLAGTALSNMFNKLDRAVEMLNLDPSKFTDLNGNLKDMASFLEEVEKGLEGMTSIEQQNKLIEVFDIRAGRVVKTLLNQVGAIRRNTLAMDLNRGATQKMADLQQNTLSAASQKAANSINTLAIAVGDSLVPVLKAGVNTLNFFARVVRDAFVALGPLGTVLAVTISALSALTVAVTIGAVTLKAFEAAGVKTALEALWTFIKGVYAASAAFITRLIPSVIATTANLMMFGLAILGVNSQLTALMLTIVVMTGGIYLLVLAVGALTSAFMAGSAAGANYAEGIESDFQAASVAASQAASDIERISKLGQTSISLRVDDDLGSGKLAKDLEAVVKSGVRNSQEAVSKLKAQYADLAAQAGETLQVFAFGREFANLFEGGTVGAKKFAEAIGALRQQTDLGFQKLDEFGQVASLGREALEAYDAMIMKSAGGNAELASSFSKVNKASETVTQQILKLTELQDEFSRITETEGFFATIGMMVGDMFDTDELTNEIDQSLALLRATRSQLADLFKDEAFRDLARRSGATSGIGKTILDALNDPAIKQAIAADAEDLGFLISRRLAGQAEKVDPAFARANSAIKDYERVVSQATTATSSATAGFQKAEDDVISFSEASRRARDGVSRLEKEIAKLEGKDFSKLALDAITRGDERPFRDIVQDFEDQLAELKTGRVGILLKNEAIAWKAVLEDQIDAVSVGELNKKLKTLASDFGESLSGAVSDFLTTGDTQSFADALREQVRTQLLAGVSESIGARIGQAFGPQILALNKQLMDAFAGADLAQIMTGGPDMFKDIVEGSELGRALGDVFDKSVNEFKEDLKEALTDTDISLDVLRSRNDLDNVTRSFAARLQEVTSRAFARGGENLQASIRETSRLLGEATAQGAENNIVRLIEKQLESLLEARKGLAESGGADKIGSSIGTGAEKLRVAALEGSKFADRLAVAAINLTKAFTGISIPESSVGGRATTAIEIAGSTANINIDVAGGSGGNTTIDEADVQNVVESLRSELTEFVDQTIRDVYEKLDDLRR